MINNFAIFITCIFALLTGCGIKEEQILYKQKPALYSYIFQDMNGNILKESFSEASITPASCQKTVTALLALELLGHNYKYETKLYYRYDNIGNISKAIISFGGDPTLTSKKLKQLLLKIKKDSFKGEIILDTTLFNISSYSRNLMLDDLGRHYMPPISAAIIDDNLIDVTISIMESNNILISNDMKYKTQYEILDGKANNYIDLLWEGDVIKANLAGLESNHIIKKRIAPLEIKDYIFRKIQTNLINLQMQNKITFLNSNTDNNKLTLINTIFSDSLFQIIERGFKKSDNLIFDILYLNITSFAEGKNINSWEEGDKILKRIIEQKYNIKLKNSLLVDGSGMSRYNKIQPKQLAAILQKGYYVNNFIKIFPKPEEKNTTLINRRNLPKNVKAKSGSMLGIDCLCGYGMKNLSPYIFVVSANGYEDMEQNFNNIIDELIYKFDKNE